jgi:stage V sporulation protein R
MGFLIEYSDLKDWEKDILHIVKEETKYFIPQIETKIINEGWACHWHHKIVNQLELPQGLYIEFLNRHNQVIRPFYGSINPYFVGFKIFEDIEKRYGKEKLFEVRKLERDQSFIRKYLTKELALKLNIFKYDKKGSNYVIEEVADEEGWKEIRDTLANMVGMGGIPIIKVEKILPKDKSLMISHEYDGRELELSYAYETLKYLVDLWGRKVILKTVVNKINKIITCNEDKTISMTGA